MMHGYNAADSVVRERVPLYVMKQEI